jgi:hypothetical protein
MHENKTTRAHLGHKRSKPQRPHLNYTLLPYFYHILLNLLTTSTNTSTVLHHRSAPTVLERGVWGGAAVLGGIPA